VAAGMALRVGEDWIYPYYRDRALCLTLGVTPLDMLQQPPARPPIRPRRRQMPSHWGHPRWNIVSGVVAYRHAVSAGGGLRGSGAPPMASRTKSRWSRAARAPPAKANSGKR